jgi:hypothetical protein
MKKITLILALMLVCATPSHAQKWLEKLGKALETVDETLNEVNDALGGDTSTSSSTSSQQGAAQPRPVTQNVNGITIETPSSVFAVQPISCQREGDDVLFVFMLQNNGNDIESLHIFGRGTGFGTTPIMDNQGNSYSYGVRMGGYVPTGTSNGDGAMPSGVPTKVSVRIFNVSKTASQMAIIQLESTWIYGQRDNFTFRNVPIVTPEIKTVASGMFITPAGAGPLSFSAMSREGQVGDYTVIYETEDYENGEYYLATDAQENWAVVNYGDLMEIYSPDFQLENGIRMGMSLAQVRQIMGSSWNPTPIQISGNQSLCVLEFSPKIGFVFGDFKDGGAAFQRSYSSGSDWSPKLSDFKTDAKMEKILIQK